MEDFEGSGIDDFSVELEDFEYVQTNKFDRIFMIGEGGSLAQNPLIHNGVVFIGSMDHNLYAINAKTGKKKWVFRTEGGIISSSPVLGDDVLFIGSRDHNFYAVDLETGKQVWKFHTNDEVMSTGLFSKGRVYFGSGDRNLYCLDADTGSLIWKFETQGEVVSRATIHEGRIFFGSYDHFLYCLDADTGSLIWKFETQGDVLSFIEFPVIDGKIYFPSFDNYLRAVHIDTGKLEWKFLTGKIGGMSAAPLLYNGILYQPNREGNLYALTTEGKQIWKFSINHAMSHPLVHEDKIYFGTEEQNLYCIDLRGKVLWKFPTQGIMWWKPAISGRNIYFVSWDCHIYCVNIDTHDLIWKFRTNGEPSYVPPPFTTYELKIKKDWDESHRDSNARKTYDLGGLEEETISEYKSRITYQISTQYASKGKYQVDSQEEEF